MRILRNKQITSLVYKEYSKTGVRITIIKNGEILNVSNLTPPMRGDNMNLSKREPHITFYNGTEASFIPLDDIININYA